MKRKIGIYNQKEQIMIEKINPCIQKLQILKNDKKMNVRTNNKK